MADLPITVHGDESVFARPEHMEWRPGHDGAPYRVCGYCGGMHPEDFADIKVANSGRVELADRKYGWPHKVYIDVANPDPGRLYCMGVSTVARDNYRPWKDLTEEERAIAKEHYRGAHPPDEPDQFGRERGFLFGTRSSLHAKFYTVHLLEPDLDPAVADRCFARIGLVLERGAEPGSVRWRPYDYRKGSNAA